MSIARREFLKIVGGASVAGSLPACVAATGSLATTSRDFAFADAGVQTAAVNGFRMSPHVYNTDDHVARVIAAVKTHRGMLV